MRITNLKEVFEKYSRKNYIRYGFPFALLCICGSLGLREFAEIRYKYRETKSFRAAMSEQGVKLRDMKELTLEAQYEKLKKIDIDNWENKRIPRPYEE